MLDQPVRIDRVGDRAVEIESDAGGLAVGGHQGDVFLHALLGGAVFGVLVPFVFVFAFFGGGGVELVGEEVDGEADGFGGGEGAELVEGCGGWLGWRGMAEGEGESRDTHVERGKEWDLANRRGEGGNTFVESITIDEVNQLQVC